jgi:hypothetical protein
MPKEWRAERAAAVQIAAKPQKNAVKGILYRKSYEQKITKTQGRKFKSQKMSNFASVNENVSKCGKSVFFTFSGFSTFSTSSVWKTRGAEATTRGKP